MQTRLICGVVLILSIAFVQEASASGDVGNFSKSAAVHGDFNGDGYWDFAGGDPGDASNAGAVDIWYDINSSSAIDETWTRDSSGILETADAGDYFGSSLAVGDFDNDGYDDLAIGVPGDDDAAANDIGSVHIIYGSAAGLTSSGDQVWNQDTSGVLGVAEAYDSFGEFLAAGDFDCDGYGDLAIGVPQEDFSSLTDAGTVHILYGSSSGLSATDDQEWTQDSSGVEGTAATDDNFGAGLGAGNLDGDSSGGYDCDDLVIGAAGEDVSSQSGAGVINVIYGTTSGLTSTGDQIWHQDSSGIVDASDLRENFGSHIGVVDDDSDGYYDVEVLVPDETSCSSGEAGHHIIYGGSGGLSDVGDALVCAPDPEPQELGCGWSGDQCFCECHLAFILCATFMQVQAYVSPMCSIDTWGTMTCEVNGGFC